MSAGENTSLHTPAHARLYLAKSSVTQHTVAMAQVQHSLQGVVQPAQTTAPTTDAGRHNTALPTTRSQAP